MDLPQFVAVNARRIWRAALAVKRYIVGLAMAPTEIRRIREALAEHPPEVQAHQVRVGWSDVLKKRVFYCDFCLQGEVGRFELKAVRRPEEKGFALTCANCNKYLTVSPSEWEELNHSEEIHAALEKRRSPTA